MASTIRGEVRHPQPDNRVSNKLHDIAIFRERLLCMAGELLSGIFFLEAIKSYSTKHRFTRCSGDSCYNLKEL